MAGQGEKEKFRRVWGGVQSKKSVWSWGGKKHWGYQFGGGIDAGTGWRGVKGEIKHVCKAREACFISHAPHPCK